MGGLLYFLVFIVLRVKRKIINRKEMGGI